jgi:hypothetical protein
MFPGFILRSRRLARLSKISERTNGGATETKREQNARFKKANLSPELDISDDTFFYLDLFFKISSIRYTGLGLEPLQPEQITVYSETFGWEKALMITLDSAYRAKITKDRETETRPPPPTGGGMQEYKADGRSGTRLRR